MIQGFARRPLWSQTFTIPAARWMPSGWRPAALNVIKALHTVIFASVGGAILLFAWEGLRQRPGRRAAIALGVALGETAIYVSNNHVCPLTPLAEELGAERGSVSDIFLPNWVGRRIPLFAGGALLLGLVLNGNALLGTRRRVGAGDQRPLLRGAVWPSDGSVGPCANPSPATMVVSGDHTDRQKRREGVIQMINRLRGLGIVLGLIGIAFIAAGGFSFFKVQEGTASLQAFSAAQGVELTYNEGGQLVDRGEPEGAQAIMALLTDDWGYPVATSELDPADPTVNTGSEYMFQMATVAYHTLNSTQTIVLEEDVTYNGELFAAGTYEFAVDGRYWADFDREHPIEGPARAQAWTGVAHALIGELGVGTATTSMLQLGLGLAALFAGVGGTFLLTGVGLVWATRPESVPVPVLRPASAIA